jgi:hypothetical protein
MRKGVIASDAKTQADKPVGFAPVRIQPSASPISACRIRHPSGWVIECDGVPPAQWLSDVLAGAAR